MLPANVCVHAWILCVLVCEDGESSSSNTSETERHSEMREQNLKRLCPSPPSPSVCFLHLCVTYTNLRCLIFFRTGLHVLLVYAKNLMMLIYAIYTYIPVNLSGSLFFIIITIIIINTDRQKNLSFLVLVM